MADRIALAEGDWPGHPSGGDAGDPDDVAIRDARATGTLEWHEYINDAEADYSFDDWALLRLASTGQWAVLHTSGCSCPSPTEEWSTVILGTAEEVCDWIVGFVGAGEARMAERQGEEFTAWIDTIRGHRG